MDLLLFFIFAFILINIFYNLFVIRKEKALKKMKDSKDVILFCRLNKIDINKVELKKLIKILSLTNSFIISLMGTLVLLLDNYIENFYVWILVSALIALVAFIPIIIILYKFIGKKIKKECR